MEEGTIKLLIIVLGFLVLTSMIFLGKKIWFLLHEKYLNLTTVKIFIGGLIPNETDISIYENYNSSEAKEIVFQKSDENGEFNCRLPRKYIGKKLKIPIMQSGFVYNHEEKIIIQPWGHFEAIKMEFDRNDAFSNLSNMADKYKNPQFTSEKYYQALYKSQYLARNQINNTKWFFMVVGVSILASLIGLGLIWWQGLIVTVAAWAIRAFLKNRTLGLNIRPIN